MAIQIPERIYTKIAAHLEAAFPNEGGGLLLGEDKDDDRGHRHVRKILPFENTFSPDEQHHRYKLPINAVMNGEDMADDLGLAVIGIFHSHPKQQAVPSAYDCKEALPWWSYLIVSVDENGAGTTRSWILMDDRKRFNEETVYILDGH